MTTDSEAKFLISFLHDPPICNLLKKIKNHDKELLDHSIKSAWLSNLVAEKMALKNECITVTTAALLHDVGKIYMPPELKSKYPLDERDWTNIKVHPSDGAVIVKNHWPQVPDLILRIIMEHHERPSGTGYPVGLTQKLIHPLSLLVAGCEAFSAMTTKRAYRLKPLDTKTAFNILKEQGIDQSIIDALYSVVENLGVMSYQTKNISFG